ncbi:aldo/keto reductase [Myxococcus sp. SDU36]|uniref:aldo/keto reductase n=1 Tax=Myxococcus sp. SDU36 TaxID=2831967 RepID=UPI002542CB0D|nr:aldo/keto reductase [Myxococcus sp. SDU36]
MNAARPASREHPGQEESSGGVTAPLAQGNTGAARNCHLSTAAQPPPASALRYLGITHYARGAFNDLERIIREEKPDFVQLPYSVLERDAEQRLLPAAAEHGVAVLVMRPFSSGTLFERVRGHPLPGWAADIDCTSWAQVFLKVILGHPAVHCPPPASPRTPPTTCARASAGCPTRSSAPAS